MGKIKLGFWLVFFLVFFSIGCNSFGQEVHMNDTDSSNSGLKMAEQNFFFDALRLRTDLNFESQKRILFTTIKDIESFRQQFKGGEMTLEYVIRDRLHTAIFLNQKKNNLVSMDGSKFSLSQNLSATELTEEVVSLIGTMYYGANEVNGLVQ
tara:strand:+ start:441 stop:896 length:456 start_codon:yes stop_codon:yes gene_type:complete